MMLTKAVMAVTAVTDKPAVPVVPVVSVLAGRRSVSSRFQEVHCQAQEALLFH
jgi:hypothetical protein